MVGFTQLTNESTPYQVIELLSDLYALFDTILDQYYFDISVMLLDLHSSPMKVLLTR